MLSGWLDVPRVGLGIATRMKSYRYIHLDVFTDRLFCGNQLAVFPESRGLAEDTMQAIAKEMNFSETAFVLPAERPDTHVRVRIFTPSEELPTAGHPTIGTAFALARTGVLGPGHDQVVFGLGVGPTPVSLAWRGDDLGFAWMTDRRPVFGTPIADPGAAAAALRLPPASVSGTALPVQTVSCGVPYLFVPLTTRRAVDNAALDADAYEALRRGAGIDDMPILLFSPEPGRDKATVYTRMFAPGLGIVEDAATGGASGALGCYLIRNKVVTPEKAGAMLSLQGVKMGRPSHIHIAVDVDPGGTVTTVRVGGESVVAGEGTLHV
jgi:trans-2,3-dihydro-3-hydroxyanthranilate isomerase